VRKEYFLVAIGFLLAGGGVYVAVARPEAITPAMALVPELYATVLAGYSFLARSREASGRERTFWRLWASGCALWTVSDLFGILTWPQSLSTGLSFFSLSFTLLPVMVLMSAMVMQPEVSEGELRDPVVRYEAALVALWWLYLYLMFVTPWRWALVNPPDFWKTFLGLHKLQDAVLVIWLLTLGIGSRGRWRRGYLHMAIGAGLLLLFLGPMYQAWRTRSWIGTMVFEALIAYAFLWLALAPLSTAGADGDPAPARAPSLGTGNVLASLTSFGIPVLAVWSRFFSSAPETVRQFRLLLSFTTMAVGILLVYLWQNAADRQGEELLVALETSVRERRRLQGHFAEAEKMVSLGHLAAGAAHEINNPVAAMLGYAELIRADAAASERARELGRKIAEQARRIRNLVQNLLSLGEHKTLEEQTVDIGALLRSAGELRLMGGRHRNEFLRIEIAENPLEVRGDPDRLLQVFYRVLYALAGEEHQKAVDVEARRGPAGRVVIEFVERANGSGVAKAAETYDAQQAQKGAGLSLGVCEAIVKEHEGSLVHQNLADGRRLFRVELPAVPRHPATAATVPAPVAQHD
jgi:signal transduction histidine kinase